jgi:hypothetical protein
MAVWVVWPYDVFDCCLTFTKSHTNTFRNDNTVRDIELVRQSRIFSFWCSLSAVDTLSFKVYLKLPVVSQSIRQISIWTFLVLAVYCNSLSSDRYASNTNWNCAYKNIEIISSNLADETLEYQLTFWERDTSLLLGYQGAWITTTSAAATRRPTVYRADTQKNFPSSEPHV